MQAKLEKKTQRFVLKDNRRLGFAEYGPPGGEPVFYFHGWPSSRLEAEAVQESIGRHGVRVIAMDRPGYGLSDFQAGRRLVDWPGDVAAVADHLGLARFSVIGVSGGAPYALACAAKIPGRVSRVTVVCGLAPLERWANSRGMFVASRLFLQAARWAPAVARRLGAFFLRRMRQQSELVLLPQIAAGLPESDRRALADEALCGALLTSSKEAFRQGVAGAAWDGCLYGRPWGFEVKEIEMPVRLWHGEDDIIVPPQMGRWHAKAIRQCEATFCPGEGHFSLPFRRIEEIMAE